MSADFPLPSLTDWADLAGKTLKGASLDGLSRIDADGLTISPLHIDGEVITAPRSERADGRDWNVRAAVEGDDPAAVNAAVLQELTGGAASILLSGAVLADPDPLGRALEGVALELAAVALDRGFDGHEAAGALAVAAKGSPRARLMFHLDPVSAFAEVGAAPRAVGDHLALAANTAARHAGPYPEARLFLATGRVVHEAGGSIGQELGFALASAACHLRAAVEAGLSVERALTGTVLGVALDAEYLDGLAKVRALRLMWRSFARAAGHECAAVIEARSSRRMLSARDPWPNLMRLTAAGFAGAVGGAEAVVVEGFSRAVGRPDAFARRLARNTQLILMEEAHLGRVDDPAAGAWFLDARTRDLAQAGWAEFQRIEAEGGLVAALKAGAVQTRVAEAQSSLAEAYAEDRRAIVGVTRYVDPQPRGAPVEPAPASAPATGGDACRPLRPIRWAAPFEEVAQ